MKISLKTLFAITSLATLVSLIAGQRMEVKKFAEEKADVIASLAVKDSRIVDYLREKEFVAVALNSSHHEIEELYVHCCENFKDWQLSLAKAKHDPHKTSVTLVPDIDRRWRAFCIHAPATKQVFLEIYAVENRNGDFSTNIAVPKIGWTKPVSFELPHGYSLFSFRNYRETPYDQNWRFEVNGESVAKLNPYGGLAGYDAASLTSWLLTKDGKPITDAMRSDVLHSLLADDCQMIDFVTQAVPVGEDKPRIFLKCALRVEERTIE